MKELREHNENMLRNILPSHVARHFLEKDRDNEVRPGPSAGTAGCRCGGRGALGRMGPGLWEPPAVLPRPHGNGDHACHVAPGRAGCLTL